MAGPKFVAYEAEIDDRELRRKFRMMPHIVGQVNRKALGDIGEATVSHSRKRYFMPGRGEARNPLNGPGTLRTQRGVRGLLGRVDYQVDSDWEARFGVLKSGPGFEYAERHEFGTVGMPQRPYAWPALQDMFQTVTAEKIMDRRFKRELEGAFDRA